MTEQNLSAYLKHGYGAPVEYLPDGGIKTAPRCTESVPVKSEPMAHHIAGLSYTASGYGAKIPTQYMVRYLNRWRRVYCRIFSNSGTLYITDKEAVNGRLIVDIERG